MMGGLRASCGVGAAFVVAGCCGPPTVELQNDGPGAATVSVSFREPERRGDREARVREEMVELAQGATKVVALPFGGMPEELTVVAKWSERTRRETFTTATMPQDWGPHAMAVSPAGMRWGSPRPKMGLGDPWFYPSAFIFLWFGGMRLYRRRFPESASR